MSADDCPLPDPEGPLSIRIPSSSIEVANKEVKLILNEVHAGNGKKCGPYKSYTASEKARIAKQAVECGVPHQPVLYHIP